MKRGKSSFLVIALLIFLVSICKLYQYDQLERQQQSLSEVEFIDYDEDDEDADSEQVKAEKRKAARVFDLSQPLEPAYLYDSIKCVDSIIYITHTLLCIHDTSRDKHVSGEILNQGAWEKHLLMPFLDLIANNPDMIVIDIGAHVGQYSLFAAKLGHRVISVEPFGESIRRLHKAAKLTKVDHQIVLLTNGVSNRRNELKLLSQSGSSSRSQRSSNLGGQGLFEQRKRRVSQSDDANLVVRTILMNDLIDYLPNGTNRTKHRAVLKIDIEGYEPIAFLRARRLLERVDVRVIMMEWGNFCTKIEMFYLIRKLVKLLTSLSYYPYSFDVALSTRDWLHWPWDVVWRKID